MSSGTVAKTNGQMGSGLRAWWQRIVYEAKRNKVSYAFIAPFMMLFSAFTIIPVIIAMVLSFTYFNMLEPPVFIGWANYIRLFLIDDIFLIAVKNTLLFAAITGPVGYLLSLIFAWLINELQPKVRAFLTLIFYGPSISGNVFLIFHIMFSGDTYGYINGFLIYYGIVDRPIQFFIDVNYMWPIVIGVVLWMSLGTSFLVFIAGLQNIDERLYEAGAMDGIRNRWQELWFLTIPSMVPMLMFGAIMSITGAFTAATQITQLVGYPSTDYHVHTIVQHLEDYGSIRFEMGYASAIAVILFMTMIIIQRLVQWYLNKLGD